MLAHLCFYIFNDLNTLRPSANVIQNVAEGVRSYFDPKMTHSFRQSLRFHALLFYANRNSIFDHSLICCIGRIGEVDVELGNLLEPK